VFRDVSDAIIAYQKFHQVRVRQEDSVVDLQESVRLSDMRNKEGTTTYVEVLEGQRSLFFAKITLAQARGTEYQSLVQLHRALGGGRKQRSLLLAPGAKAMPRTTEYKQVQHEVTASMREMIERALKVASRSDSGMKWLQAVILIFPNRCASLD